jgi:hypothetical protein
MVTDAQVRVLRRRLMEAKTQEAAAAGMSVRSVTARSDQGRGCGAAFDAEGGQPTVSHGLLCKFRLYSCRLAKNAVAASLRTNLLSRIWSEMRAGTYQDKKRIR